MRKNVTLHIGGIQADLDSNALILFNYTQEDLQNPTIVKNSYSQQVTLKGTDVNNRIFGTYFRNDRVTGSGFNALAKTPFKIYNEMNEVLESGYCKLESVEKNGADISYKVSLYGGLGGFLYNMMYDADGNKKTLADLIYTSNGDEHEFDFPINKDAVASAWMRLQGDSTQDVIWDHINFAPCYNGLPGGGFAAEKAFCPTACYGVTSSVTDGGVTYSSRHSNVLVKLSKKYNEWEVGDLRSYLQRPVVRMKSIIDAIADSSQNGGYTVELDSSFFKSANKHYQDTWLTLPRLDSIQMPISSGSSTVLMPTGDSTYVTGSTTKDASLTNGNKGMNVLYDCSLTVQPCLQMPEGVSNDARLLTVERKDVSQTVCRRMVVVYQLLGYNSNGELVAGSDIIAATTSVKRQKDATHVYSDYTSTKQWLTKYNNAVSVMGNEYHPTWGTIDVNASTSLVLGEKFANGMLVDGNGNNKTVTLTLKGYGISMVRLRTTVLNVYESGTQSAYNSFTFTSYGYAYELDEDSSSSTYGFAIDPQLVSGMNHTSGTVNYSWQSEGVQVRSNADITKQILLGGTASPADYLLAYCKMYGLYMLYDSAHKKVKIVTRNTLYKPNNGNTRVYDLEHRIDRASMNITPYVLDSRWYEFGNPYLKGAWADYYEEIKGIRYGTQRVNTGFSFNANHKDVLKDIVINGACEVLEQSKQFVNITQDGKVCPAVFLDGGTYTLWDSSGNNKDLDVQMPTPSATIEYFTSTFKGYDYWRYPKLQFHDKDNKALDGSNVMVMFTGSGYHLEYARICITDDSFLMTELNEGVPCWLIGQATVSGHYGISTADIKYPIFRRYDVDGTTNKTITLSLDFGTPLEISEPDINIPNPDTTNIYAKGWKLYIQDRYDVDTRIVRCKVNLRGLGEQIGQNLMRNFYYFDSSYWVLNKITNYSITTEDLVDCEFIKIKSTTNYSAGQTY